MVHRVDHVQQLPRAFAIAERGERHRGPDRAVRVLAAVLAHAGHVAADVAGVRPALVERRIEQLDQLRARAAPGARRARPSPHASAPGRRRPTAPTSSARSNRSGIRRCWPSRAACRRRSRRGGTRRRPTRVPRAARAAARARSRSAAAKAVVAVPAARGRRTVAAPRTGRSRATRSRPCRGGRPGSCRRSSRRRPSAAGRARRSAGRAGPRATQCSYRLAVCIERPGRS